MVSVVPVNFPIVWSPPNFLLSDLRMHDFTIKCSRNGRREGEGGRDGSGASAHLPVNVVWEHLLHRKGTGGQRLGLNTVSSSTAALLYCRLFAGSVSFLFLMYFLSPALRVPRG